MNKKLCALLIIAVFLCSCETGEQKNGTVSALPAPETDKDSQFGVDNNININTIDSYLFRDDVYYRDVRMLFDPADYEAIGGEATLTKTIKGFKVVPYPYIATLENLPVSNAYDGKTLFEVKWNSDGSIESVTENYKESEIILNELFPKDKAIFLMCGGGGYSGMMKKLLLYLGWDEKKIYNIGGNWEYKGNNSLELVIYPEDAKDDIINATWRADYAFIDFERLHVKQK